MGLTTSVRPYIFYIVFSMHDLESTDCRLCGGKENQTFLKKDGLSLAKCSTCGLVYLNPRPKAMDLKQLYDKRFRKIEGGPAHSFDDFLKDPKGFSRNYRISRLRYIKKYARGPRLLDVGCAYGIFLYVASQSGYKVSGVEMSSYSAETARKKFNVDVYNGSLAGAAFKPSIFDVVTLWDVLEHLMDPLAELREVHRLLKPGGLIAIQLPNLRGLDVAILKEKWGWLQLPYHLYFFTPSTLKQMVEKSGFEVVGLRTYHVDLWDIMLRKFFKRYDKGRRSAIVRRYDDKKRTGALSFHIFKLLKNFFYILSAVLKYLIYPWVILAKRGSLIQLYAVRK